MAETKTSWADESEELFEQPPPKPTVNAWAKGNPLAPAPTPQENAPVGIDRNEFPDIGTVPEKKKERTESKENFYDKERNRYEHPERRERDQFDGRSRDFERRDRSFPPRERDFERRDSDRRDFERKDRYPRREFGSRGYDRRDQRRDNDRKDFGRGFRDRRAPRAPREPREPLPIPTSPPFTAFVGNLSFEMREEEISRFFEDSKLFVKNVRLVIDRNLNRSKGFCYVEFEDADSLKRALDLDGQELLSRQIRVDVAEQRPEEKKSPVEEPSSPKGERPKLNLKPPSSKTVAEPSVSDAYAKAKVNPFGGAKPRDENYFQKKKEEERKKRELETKEKEEKEAPTKAAEEETPKSPEEQKSAGEKQSPQLKHTEDRRREEGISRDRGDRRPYRGDKRQFRGDRRDSYRRDDRERRGDRKDDRERRGERRGERDRRDYHDKDKRDDKRFSRTGRRDDKPPRRETPVEMPVQKKETRTSSLSQNPFDALSEEQD